MDSNLTLFLFLGFFAWLAILSFFLWKSISHYNKLVAGITDKNFKSLMENLLKDVSVTKKDIDFLKSYCDRIHKEGFLHIQKIGLVRFNPFRDTGGDQSFILSLVNKDDTGVIISGLYARSGTRWYAKQVVRGKAVEHDLSEEEKKALKEGNKHYEQK